MTSASETLLPNWAVDLRPGLRKLQHTYDLRPLGRESSRVQTIIRYPTQSYPGISDLLSCPEGGWILGGEPQLIIRENGSGHLTFKTDPPVVDDEYDPVHMVWLEFSHIRTLGEDYGARTYEAVLGGKVCIPVPGTELVSLNRPDLRKERYEDGDLYFCEWYTPENEISTSLLVRGMQVEIEVRTLDPAR